MTLTTWHTDRYGRRFHRNRRVPGPRILVTLGLALGLAACSSTPEPERKGAPPIPTGQRAMVFEGRVEGVAVTLPYYLFIPHDYNRATGPLPVMLFLHGAGERGRRPEEGPRPWTAAARGALGPLSFHRGVAPLSRGGALEPGDPRGAPRRRDGPVVDGSRPGLCDGALHGRRRDLGPGPARSRPVRGHRAHLRIPARGGLFAH